MYLQLFLLVLSAHIVGGFVYSCDEVKYQLMNNNFEVNTKYAYVITEDIGTDPDQLNDIYLQQSSNSISFFNITYVHNSRMTNWKNESWTITGDDKSLSCNQQFTLIFTSDETDVRRAKTIRHDNTKIAGSFTAHSYVIVVPEVGFWLSKLSMAGEGNFTVYTGAGIGEEEERYEMQSWDCESMPDWIFYFGIVLTIEADESCSYLFQYSSDLAMGVTVYPHDRIAVLLSGRSDNLQNKKHRDPVARVQIGDEESSNTTWNMQISLDSSDSFLEILDGRDGINWDYKTGTYTDKIFTDYFEVAWQPKILQSNQIWKNNDFVYVEIQVSPWNEDFVCPEGYAQVKSVDGQQWCYMIVWPIPPIAGFNFSKSMEICAESEGWLPIITSAEMQSSMESFVNWHLGNDNVWLGLICDTETDTLVWQDGEEMVYEAFHNSSRVLASGYNCSTESMNYGLEFSILENDMPHWYNYWRRYAPDREFSYAVCATRPLEFSSSSVPTTISTPIPSPLPAWAITLIVISCVLIIVCFVGIILIFRRRIQSLQAKVVEEQMVNKLGDPSQKARSRYYDIANKNEWEIERLFVSIDINRKLGEGAFGSVFVGHVLAKNIPLGVGRSIAELSALTNNNDTVAVKMLHENADAQRENEFLSEIDLMKKIGYHERLVNMLACVTSSKPVLLICEYCSNGDLLEYLRTKRKFMIENPEVINSAEIITVKRQLMFAIQIAYGMEFLSSQGFIHRDLAARNIMVDHQESCKIGDFGLARSIGVENENYQAQGGKLPLKWMSPEAIDKYFFSTATDVWSFGVLLFEIVTLGGSPYAGWPATEILSRLKRGERMEKTDNCSDSLYDLMRVCWSEQLADRPSFSDIREHIGDLLEDINQDDYYLKLNPRAHYYVLESNASE